MIVPNAPAHHDTTHLKWAEKLRQHAGVIREEWDAFETFIGGAKGLADFRYWDDKPAWKTVYLSSVGNVNAMIATHFPRTLSVLFTTPVMSAAFSVLPPGEALRPHNGEYKGILRYHLTLWATNQTVRWDEKWKYMSKRMPDLDLAPFASLPHLSAGKVRTGPVALKNEPIPAAHLGVLIPRHDADLSTGNIEEMEGIVTLGYLTDQDLLFDDTFYHYAVNMGIERRITLFCDVPRHDLPFVPDLLNQFLLWVVAPHMEFTRSYIMKNIAALKTLGFDAQLVAWYNFPPWRQEFLPSWWRRLHTHFLRSAEL
jgi:aspartyl/asparaginyl beta-hydroxylase (cupin superfamily)